MPDERDDYAKPTSSIYRAYPRDFFLLCGARPAGPVIGHLDGHDIAETVMDIDGNRYTYGGLAPRRRDGAIDWESLKRGQYLVEPCFVYEFAPPLGVASQHTNLRTRLRDWLRAELPALAIQNVFGNRR